jgi:hypothetical protein
MGRVARRHQKAARKDRVAGVAERKLGVQFWLASGGDLTDDVEWAGDDRSDSDVDAVDDAVDDFLLKANSDGAPDPDDDADSWAGDGRDQGSDDDTWVACDDELHESVASDPDSDSSDGVWAREWARTLSTDAAPASLRGARTDSGDEEARLAREMLGDAAVVDDSGGESSDEESVEFGVGDEAADKRILAELLQGFEDDAEDQKYRASEPQGDWERVESKQTKRQRKKAAQKPPPPDSSSGDESSDASDAAPAIYREPIVTARELKRKRTGGGGSPRGGVVRARADSKTEVRRQRRAAKFAAEAARAPPPVPKKVMAHPGGKITSNKEEATAKFLRRQGKRGAEDDDFGVQPLLKKPAAQDWEEVVSKKTKKKRKRPVPTRSSLPLLLGLSG